MPHIILEYSANIRVEIDSDVLNQIHKLLSAIETFKLEDIKSRVIRHENFCAADGTKNKAFIHLQLALLPGRPKEVLQTASARLLEFLKVTFFKNCKDLDCAYSVEVREFNKEIYSKA